MYQNCAFVSVLVKCKPLLTNSSCSRFTKSSSRFFARSWVKEKECFKTSNANTVLAPSSLLKPAVFTVLISSASFTGAAIWQYENMRYHVQQAFRTPKKWLQGKMEPSRMWLEDKFRRGFQTKQGSFRKLCNSWWNSLTEGQKMFISIAFVNIIVFVSWKVPALSGLMSRYFVSHSVDKISCWSLLLCTFSHNNVVHLCMNMIVLNAFISSLVDNLGKEQFLAFYISAGVFSSLFSSANRVLRGQASASLGASGNIMGMLAYFCFQYPDNMLNIVFLPFIVFKASTGIKTLIDRKSVV